MNGIFVVNDESGRIFPTKLKVTVALPRFPTLKLVAPSGIHLDVFPHMVEPSKFDDTRAPLGQISKSIFSTRDHLFWNLFQFSLESQRRCSFFRKTKDCFC